LASQNRARGGLAVDEVAYERRTAPPWPAGEHLAQSMADRDVIEQRGELAGNGDQ
jgi:hypothetical protein